MVRSMRGNQQVSLRRLAFPVGVAALLAMCVEPASADAVEQERQGLSASVAVVQAHIRPMLRHASKAVHAVHLFPGQGIVALAAGGVHQDADADALLDAGELIDYRYTVVNVGDVVLSGLAVSDRVGSVGCPLTSLSAGAHMICTRSYVVAGVDATAGLVMNEVEVHGLDDGAREVRASDVVLTQNLAAAADLRVFKSPQVIEDADATATVSVGDRLRYRFLLANSGGVDLASVTLSEPDASRIDTPIDCAPTSLGGAAFAGSGSGTLLAGDSVLCSAEYTVRVSDADIGQVLNLVEARASAPVVGQVFASGASVVAAEASPPPLIGVAKGIRAISGRGPFLVTFDMVVRNFGVIALTDVQVTEDLRDTFPAPVAFSVQDLSVTGSAVANPAFDGDTDVNLFDASQSTLAVGGEIVVVLSLQVDPQGLRGPFFNTVVARGRGTNDVVVSDDSVYDANPDPNGDGTPDEGSPTPIRFPGGVPPIPQPATIPAGSFGSFLLLALGLCLVAGWLLRTR